MELPKKNQPRTGLNFTSKPEVLKHKKKHGRDAALIRFLISKATGYRIMADEQKVIQFCIAEEALSSTAKREMA